MIRITSKKDGFRRAGIAHSSVPADYPDDRFSEEQLAALEAEPMLTNVSGSIAIPLTGGPYVNEDWSAVPLMDALDIATAVRSGDGTVTPKAESIHTGYEVSGCWRDDAHNCEIRKGQNSVVVTPGTSGNLKIWAGAAP